MPHVAVTSRDESNSRKCLQAIAGYAQTRLITPQDPSAPADQLLAGVGGLFLTGDTDVDPTVYGESPDPEAGLDLCPGLDSLELRLLRCALERDMPVLGICRGMQLLNVAFGGRLLQCVPGHDAEQRDGRWSSARHSIYVSPGSKLAAILGMGGFFRVNSLHRQALREAQKSPSLLASAYSLEDAVIEGLESPAHSWVIGVQCHPELQDEVPKAFANLFMAFVERAEGYVALKL